MTESPGTKLSLTLNVAFVILVSLIMILSGVLIVDNYSGDFSSHGPVPCYSKSDTLTSNVSEIGNYYHCYSQSSHSKMKISAQLYCNPFGNTVIYLVQVQLIATNGSCVSYNHVDSSGNSIFVKFQSNLNYSFCRSYKNFGCSISPGIFFVFPTNNTHYISQTEGSNMPSNLFQVNVTCRVRNELIQTVNIEQKNISEETTACAAKAKDIGFTLMGQGQFESGHRISAQITVFGNVTYFSPGFLDIPFSHTSTTEYQFLLTSSSQLE